MDGKIQCHLLLCVITFVSPHMIEEIVNANRAEDAIRGPATLDRMRKLHSASLLYPEKREAERVLETQENTQPKALSVFNYRVTDGEVLQKVLCKGTICYTFMDLSPIVS